MKVQNQNIKFAVKDYYRNKSTETQARRTKERTKSRTVHKSWEENGYNIKVHNYITQTHTI